MPARTSITPPYFLTAPPITNPPITHTKTRTTKPKPIHHHCPHKLNGPHHLNHRCLTNNHVGYCETCKYLASQYIGCNKCGSRRLSRVPPSHFSRVTGETGNEGVAQNVLVTSRDVLCGGGGDNENGNEDEGWSKEQERKAREEARVRDEVSRGKEKKVRSGDRGVSEGRIEEVEKARKEQQRQTDRNRLTRGIRGLLRRK